MSKHSRSTDLLFVLAVVGVTVALVLPSRGGIVLNYMDNPIHLAEVYALAG